MAQTPEEKLAAAKAMHEKAIRESAIRRKQQGIGIINQPGYTPTTPSPAPATPTAPEGFTYDPNSTNYEEQLAGLQQQKSELEQQAAKAVSGAGNIRQTAYDKIFGSGSDIASFFNPNLQTTQQAITEINQELSKLPADVKERNVDTGLTEAQYRRITAKEREGLTSQLSDLTASYNTLTAGLSNAMNLGEKQYAAMVDDSQAAIDATIAELQSKSDLTDAQIATVKDRLQAKLDDSVTKKKGVDDILSNAIKTIQYSGISPSSAFDKVVKDAYAMADQGVDLGQIEAAVMRAIGQNPAVAAYLSGVSTKKSTSKSSSGGSKFDSWLESKLGGGSSSGSGWMSNLANYASKY